jgi:chemotaxis protein histidine kinase CheA/ActR/RegA family two-component response regulator
MIANGPIAVDSAIATLDHALLGSEPTPSPAVDSAVERLRLMAEVCHCLMGSGGGEDAIEFLVESTRRLVEGLKNGEADELAATILRDSKSRWGDYLALLDASLAIPEEENLFEEAGPPTYEEETSDRDAADLLRTLVNLTGPAPSNTTAQTPTASPTPSTALPSLTPHDVRTPQVVPTQPSQVIEEANKLELDEMIREAFVEDARDVVARIQSFMLGDAGLDLPDLRRCLHTLKGAASTIGLSALGGWAHVLEDRAADLLIDLERFVSTVESVIAAMQREPSPSTGPWIDEPPMPEAAPSPKTPTFEAPSRVVNPEAPEKVGAVRMASGQLEALLEVSGELLARRRLWKQQARDMDQLAALVRSCAHRAVAEIDRFSEGHSQLPGGRGLASQRGQEAVARLCEQAGDLAELATAARAAAQPLKEEAESLDRLSMNLWDSLQSLRFVPARGLLQRLVRVGMDAARQEGREVRFQIVGEETLLERSLAERLYEPMLHVVRNAVAHGIEAPARREASGKAATGQITLEASREGGQVALSVADDGQGLDFDAIAAKGLRHGLIRQEEAANREALLRLIFQPGFSTRSQVAELAGRGVGMDVVDRTIADLSGSVDLTTEPGKGTRLTARLPAQVDVVPAMIVRVGDQSLAVPILSIVAVRDARRREDDGASLADDATPIWDARSILGTSSLMAPRCPRLLVVQGHGQRARLRVDEVLGTEDLVMRPLPALLSGHPALVGTSRRMNGDVVLIVDVHGMRRLASNPTAHEVAVDENGDRPVILVVDDSISVRRISARALRTIGMIVHEASDGQEALVMLKRPDLAFDLVLSDLEMPRLDGFALLREMRRTGLLARAPLILTSTRSSEETRRTARELGARAFLAKPVEPRELQMAVSQAVAEARNGSRAPICPVLSGSAT